jgi:hypothetical protein
MKENLFKPNVDTSVVDNLISGTLVTAKVVPVTVTGTGIVKRGTLLSSSDGENFAADADDPDSNVGPAAFGGEFNQNKIEDVMSVTLTPLAIHKARIGARIFIAPMNPAPETF